MFIFVMIHMLMHVLGAFCGYNQAFLCQKVEQPEHSVLFSMSNNFPSPLYNYHLKADCLQEAQQEVNDIMRSASSNVASEVKPGAAFYNGAFVKPGGHLVQRQVTEQVSYV